MNKFSNKILMLENNDVLFSTIESMKIFNKGYDKAKQQAAELTLQADAHIEELEADLKTTRATIRIMDQTKGYMQERIEELENALRKIADSYCECRADASEIAKKALDSSQNS